MKPWRDITVRTKFNVGMLVLFLVVAASSVLFYTTLNSLSASMGTLNSAAELRQRLIVCEVQHLQWVNNLSIYLVNDGQGALTVQKDPTKCGFGTFYYGAQKNEMLKLFPAISAEMAAIEKPHQALHATAQPIEDQNRAGNVAEARRIFSQTTLPALEQVQKLFTAMNAALEGDIGQHQAGFAGAVSSALRVIIVMGGISLLAVIALVILLSGSILKPIRHISRYSQACLTGGSMKLDVSGKDELGTLGANLGALMDHLNTQLAFSQGILSGISVPCSVFSPEDRTVFTNRPMMELLELDGKPEDYYGQTSGHYIWGDASKETLSTRALRENKTLSAQREFSTRKGNSRHAMISSAPFHGKNGEILGTLSIWIDVTEVVEKQLALEENGRRISEVAASAMGVAHAVSSANSEISVQVEQASQGAGIQSGRVAETAVAMEQMNQAVMAVAGSASSASSQAAESVDNARQGSELVRLVMEGINRVGEHAGTVAASMSQLNASADSIGRIIDVINDIADQTNLLALNAAIEAARAGEAGRGFSVVADEVRKLAEKTMDATREVADVIRGIQKGAQDSNKSVENAAGALNEAKDMAEKAEQSLDVIVTMGGETASQVLAIASAAEEQSATCEQINAAIGDINKISEETRLAMNEAAQGVLQLAEQSQSLQSLIDRLQASA